MAHLLDSLGVGEAAVPNRMVYGGQAASACQWKWRTTAERREAQRRAAHARERLAWKQAARLRELEEAAAAVAGSPGLARRQAVSAPALAAGVTGAPVAHLEILKRNVAQHAKVLPSAHAPPAAWRAAQKGPRLRDGRGVLAAADSAHVPAVRALLEAAPPGPPTGAPPPNALDCFVGEVWHVSMLERHILRVGGERVQKAGKIASPSRASTRPSTDGVTCEAEMFHAALPPPFAMLVPVHCLHFQPVFVPKFVVVTAGAHKSMRDAGTEMPRDEQADATRGSMLRYIEMLERYAGVETPVEQSAAEAEQGDVSVAQIPTLFPRPLGVGQQASASSDASVGRFPTPFQRPLDAGRHDAPDDAGCKSQ